MVPSVAKVVKVFSRGRYENSWDIRVEAIKHVKLRSITATGANTVGYRSAFKWGCVLTVSFYFLIYNN